MRFIDWSSDVCSSDLCGMRLYAGRYLVLGDIRKGDAADLLPVAQELVSAQSEQPAEGFLKRVCLSRDGTRFVTKVASAVEAREEPIKRGEASGVGRSFQISKNWRSTGLNPNN